MIVKLKDGGYVTRLEPLGSDREQIENACEMFAQALKTGDGLAKAVYFVDQAMHPWQVRCAQESYGQSIPFVPFWKAVKESCECGRRVEKLPMPRPDWAAKIRAWIKGLA